MDKHSIKSQYIYQNRSLQALMHRHFYTRHDSSLGRIACQYMAVVQCDSFTQTNNIIHTDKQYKFPAYAASHSKHVTACLKHTSANSFFARLTKCTCKNQTVWTVLFMYPKMTRERGIWAFVNCISFAVITDISARELLY